VQSSALCRRTKATLLIAKLDRLARNVAFVSSLMESGVEFVATDAPYANRLMIHILAAFAEHERTLISERTKAALAAARRRGIKLGQNGRLLAAKNKQSAVEFADRLRDDVNSARSSGARTLVEISVALNASGKRTREGSHWSPSTTARLLARLDERKRGEGREGNGLEAVAFDQAGERANRRTRQGAVKVRAGSRPNRF
jgi:DNA invertase Pin-like site-specific DNA recombinase